MSLCSPVDYDMESVFHAAALLHFLGGELLRHCVCSRSICKTSRSSKGAESLVDYNASDLIGGETPLPRLPRFVFATCGVQVVGRAYLT